MKIDSVSNVSFQKKLQARTSVGVPNYNQRVNIYKFDKVEDFQDFKRALQTKEWDNSYYLSCLIEDHQLLDFYSVYTMENSGKELLCFAVTDNRNYNDVHLEFIETAPEKTRQNRKDKKDKWIGETMLSFLVKKAKDKKFVVPNVASNDGSEKFYIDNCHFTKMKNNSAVLNGTDFTQLISQNEHHTGHKIELVG